MHEAQPAELADWEKTLQGIPIDPQDVPAQKTPLHAQWQVLEDVPRGGTVDLTEVWEPIRLSQAHYEYRGWELVQRLVDASSGRGWTVAQRLLQALQEMTASADGQVVMDVTTPQTGHIIVTAWCWSGNLPWWVQAELEVVIGARGRTRIQPTSPVVLVTKGWDEGPITYRDGQDGPLGRVLTGWLIGWAGRLSIQALAGMEEEAGELPDLVTAEEFAASLR
ncbi:hypothetical protein [Streptosporangium sp. NPDC002524]|uniref:hypothetical protein n=1 Tax=Streptosporangium sp. NPDC002524 TaxID=3154537 RepID=UPI00332E6250